MSGPLRAGAGRLLRPAQQAGAPRSGFVIFVVSHLTWIAVAAVVMAHLVLADDAYPPVARLLLSVPAVLLLVEGRDYLKSERRELPMGPWALAQFYLSFGFPVFFDLPFFTLAGPVSFSPEARVTGGMVVALGAVSLWAGLRLGFGAGDRLRAFTLRAVPPVTLPARWDDAFFAYACASIALPIVMIFVAFPVGVQLPATLILGLDFALGLALAIPSRRFGGRGAAIIAAVIGGQGLLRGMLDPIFRAGATYLAGQWLNTRRLAIRVIVICAAIYVVLQPVKQSYRRQVWVSTDREQVGMLGRVAVWEQAIEDFYSDEPRSKADEPEPLASRLSELGGVMNVAQVVPGRIDYLMGESFLQILYAPIPRIIWPDKPTTRDLVQQRYAVIFGLQTDEGARSTAVNLPLLVEGWWNFGWIGVALVGLLAGLWTGAAQRAFAGEHWAMRALGYAYLAQTNTVAAVASMYASIFQTFAGRMIAVWGIYWLAKMLSGRQRIAPPTGRRAAVRPVAPRGAPVPPVAARGLRRSPGCGAARGPTVEGLGEA